MEAKHELVPKRYADLLVDQVTSHPDLPVQSFKVGFAPPRTTERDLSFGATQPREYVGYIRSVENNIVTQQDIRSDQQRWVHDARQFTQVPRVGDEAVITLGSNGAKHNVVSAPSIEELSDKLRSLGRTDTASRINTLDRNATEQYAHDQEQRSMSRWNLGKSPNDLFERQAELRSDATAAHLVSSSDLKTTVAAHLNSSSDLKTTVAAHLVSSSDLKTTIRPADHERHYAPLNKELHPEDAKQFGWKAENGTVQSYQHATTQRHIHIDGPSGQFYNQQKEPITQHAALDKAMGVGNHHAPEPAKVHEPIHQRKVDQGVSIGL